MDIELKVPRIGGLLVVFMLGCAGFAGGEEGAQPPRMKGAEPETGLVSDLKKGVKDAGLEINRMNLSPRIEDASSPFVQTRVLIEVSGAPEKVQEWIKGVHDFNEFRAIAYFKSSPRRGKPAQQTCSVMVHGWFLPAETKVEGGKLDALWKETVKKYSLPHSPVEVWREVEACVPKDSGLLLERVEVVEPLNNGAKQTREVGISGRGKALESVNSFNLSLKKKKSFALYRWETPAPSQLNTGGWHFRFSGTRER